MPASSSIATLQHSASSDPVQEAKFNQQQGPTVSPNKPDSNTPPTPASGKHVSADSRRAVSPGGSKPLSPLTPSDLRPRSRKDSVLMDKELSSECELLSIKNEASPCAGEPTNRISRTTLAKNVNNVPTETVPELSAIRSRLIEHIQLARSILTGRLETAKKAPVFSESLLSKLGIQKGEDGRYSTKLLSNHINRTDSGVGLKSDDEHSPSLTEEPDDEDVGEQGIPLSAEEQRRIDNEDLDREVVEFMARCSSRDVEQEGTNLSLAGGATDDAHASHPTSVDRAQLHQTPSSGHSTSHLPGLNALLKQRQETQNGIPCISIHTEDLPGYSISCLQCAHLKRPCSQRRNWSSFPSCTRCSITQATRAATGLPDDGNDDPCVPRIELLDRTVLVCRLEMDMDDVWEKKLAVVAKITEEEAERKDRANWAVPMPVVRCYDVC